jgi:outer membrane biogenesis lipoprotein LolB
MKYLKLLSIVVVLFLAGCGGTQRAANNATAEAKKAKVLKAHEAAPSYFKTITARLSVSYKNLQTTRSFTVNLRMEKGKKIWMSATILGFTGAKVYITPDQVQFYEKLNRRAFEGDFSLISDFLGEEITFEQLEDLLLGQAVEPLKSKDFAVVNNEYQFKQDALITKFFSLRPSDFKLSEQSISNPLENSFLKVSYPEYQVAEGRIIPAEIKIDAHQRKRVSKLEMEFKNVEFDQELTFPFHMPSGYSPFEL